MKKPLLTSMLLVAVFAILNANPIEPIADAYVRGGDSANVNYGSEQALYAKKHEWGDETYTRISYLKFDLTGIGTVDSAKFKIYLFASNGTETQGLKLVNDNSWTEDGLTYNNRPENIGDTLGFWSTTDTGWIEIDITNAVNSAAGSQISFIIEGSTNAIYAQYYSKEGLYKPQIILYGIITNTREIDLFGNPQVTLYPNPLFEGIAYLNLEGYKTGEEVNVSIFNVLGEMIDQKEIKIESDQPKRIEIFNHQAKQKGMFIIQIKSESRQQNIKLLVQ